MSNLKELYLCADLTDYPDSGRNCHPDIIYFRGTEEQWNAVKFGTNTLANFEKYGTVIVFNYGSETGDAPEITQQPESATYEQGLRPRAADHRGQRAGGRAVRLSLVLRRRVRRQRQGVRHQHRRCRRARVLLHGALRP